MPSFLRTLILACIFLGLTLGLVTTIAMAKTLHRHHHHVTHHASSDTHLRIAQSHLLNLGYYTGKVDGLTGPKTKLALKNFQHDHHLPVNGKLTPRTYSAILEADKKLPHMLTAAENIPPVKPEHFYEDHPDFYGHYDQQYANPLQNNDPQTIPSRYGKLEVTKNAAQGQTNYNLTFNGQPLLIAEDQPSVIGVSKSFDLGTEDDIVVSTYRSESTICPYKNYLLTLQTNGNKTQEIGNCTHGYQASVKDGSLWIVFPEEDTGRAVGSTWRYEPGDLEKL